MIFSNMIIRLFGGSFFMKSKYMTISSVKNNRMEHLTSVYCVPGIWKVGKIYTDRRFVLYNNEYNPEWMYLDKYNTTFDKLHLDRHTRFSDLFNPEKYIDLDTKPGQWDVIYSASRTSEFSQNMFILFINKQ